MRERKHVSKDARGVIGVAALMALISIIAVLSSGNGVTADTSFNPDASIEISDDEASANANVTSMFDVAAPDYNYAELTSFTPAAWGVASDEDLPNGAHVGTLHADSTLGLLNAPCATPFPVDFDLYDASTETADTVSWEEGFLDGNGNGLADGIDKYPEFLNELFPGKTPRSRSYGHTSVAGTPVSIQFLVFEPGDVGPASRGYGSATVLNDPTAPLEPGAITDFCTPLGSTTVTFGISKDNSATADDESGFTVRTNPRYGGTYTFSWIVESMYDADGGGIENDLDTCPIHLPDGDPRDVSEPFEGDADMDGLEDPCDPDPATYNNDEDYDGYPNRQDNCPLVSNGQTPGEDNQADEDLDAIGDACDVADWNGDTEVDDVEEAANLNPNTPDGIRHTVTLEDDVDISGPAPGEEIPGETTLSEDASAGDTEIAVEDMTGFEEEDTIEIGEEGGDTTETNWITGIEGGSAGTFSLLVALEFDHDAGEPVEKIEAVPTPTPEEGTPTPTPEEGTPTPTVVEGSPTPTVEAEYCSPVFPGTYNGLVRIDGQPAASGYEVTASIGGVQWGSALVSGGRYAMDIPDHMPTAPPCFEGGTITFALDAMECTASPDADWASGIHTVDLSCAAAPPVTPEVTPTLTPTLTPTPTITPTTVPPTGAGGLSGSGPGLPVWAMALAGWAGLTIIAGLGTLVAAKRR